MLTFQEIGLDYAARVRAALDEDRRQNLTYFQKALARETITPGQLAGTGLVAALKKIAAELDTRWKVNDALLTEQQKEEILRAAGRELGLENPGEFVWLTKGASNDAYMQMVTYISTLLQSAGKK